MYLHRQYSSAGSKVVKVALARILFLARCTRSREESTVSLELSSTMYLCEHSFLEILKPQCLCCLRLYKSRGLVCLYTNTIIYNKDTGLAAKGKKRMFCNCITEN